MVDGLLLALAVALCLIGAVKGRQHRQTGLSTHGWLAFVFGLLALAILLRVSPVYVWIGQTVGLQSLPDAMVRTALMGAAFGAQSLIRLVSMPGSPRLAWRGGRCVTLLVALAGLWSAFVVGHLRGDVVFGSFARAELWPTVYIVAFLGYMAVVAGDVMNGCWHYARSADGALRFGLRLMALGCANTLLYAVFKGSALVLAHEGSPVPSRVEAQIGQAGALLTAVPVAVGVALPALVRGVRALSEWRRRYAAHDQLYPLWSALMSVSPALALEPAVSRTRDRLRVRDLDMRLYRRAIEIRDGRLAIRDFLAPSVAEARRDLARSEGVAGSAADAFVEARVLEAALAAVAAGSPAPAEPWAGIGPHVHSTAMEVKWLRAVAANFTASPRDTHWGQTVNSWPAGRPRWSRS